ncbi:MAG: hypothetical protein WA609_06270 [Terriglobales bacterium]
MTSIDLYGSAQVFSLRCGGDILSGEEEDDRHECERNNERTTKHLWHGDGGR